jgi:hypothetical protein
MSSSNSSSSIFYLLLGGLLATSSAGLYLIYKNMKNKDEDELPQEVNHNKNLRPNISINLNENNDDLNKRNFSDSNENKIVLTVQKATEIYAEITKCLEEYCEILDSHLAKEERRKALQIGESNWIQLVSLLLTNKHLYFEKQKKHILEKYNVLSHEFEKIVSQKMSFSELEKEVFKVFKPQFKNIDYPLKDKVKKAYIFHCEKMTETLQNSSKINSSYTNQEEKTFFMLMERVRIDDELYFKYDLTFNQLKYLINYYDLYSDPDVQYWYNIIPS